MDFEDELHNFQWVGDEALLKKLGLYKTKATDTQEEQVPNPDLDRVVCVARNRDGEILFEEKMPEVEFLKIFRDLFDHVERINKGHAFRVW